MFRSTAQSLRAWWIDFSDDILGADLPPSSYEEEPDAVEHHLTHPHRRPLATNHVRRDGAVAARPAHCLSPVRPAGTRPAGTWDPAARLNA
jgi:hypothetical protein